MVVVVVAHRDTTDTTTSHIKWTTLKIKIVCVGGGKIPILKELQEKFFLVKSVYICVPFVYINPLLIQNTNIKIGNEFAKIFF